MFKKIISIILVIIMISGIFSTEVFIRTNAQTVLYDSADKYVADCLTYGFINPETGNSELTPYVSSVILRDFTYEILAEAIIDEEQLIYNSVFWNNLRKSLKGEFLEIANWQEAFYTVLLMDYLNYSSNTYEYNNYLIENTVKYADEVCSAIIEYSSDWYEGNVDDLIKNSSLTDAVEFSEKYGYLYKLNKFNTLKEDILKVSQNAWEYYNNLSKALAIREANENKVNFLKSLRNEASGDTYLISAIDKIVDWYTASYATLAFDNAVSVMANYSVSATFDCIVKAFPTLKNIVAALKISTGGLDLLFNSDDLSENNLKILLLYIINSNAVGVLQDARDNYKNSNTDDNALKLNDAFLCYVDFQNYASYHTKSFISSIFYDGILNKIENIFSDSNKVAYDEFQDYLEQDIIYCETMNNNVNAWYGIYRGIWGNDSDLIVDNQGGGTAPTIKIEKVSFEFDNYTLFFNQTLTVNAVVYPSNASDTELTYYSADTSVATVNNQGKITPVKPGEVTIFAKSSNGIKGSFDLTVLPFKVSEHSDGYVLTKYVGEETSVEIPSYVHGKAIKEIGSRTFYNCGSLKSITIPDSVTSIGERTFTNCSSLTSITIPNSVTNIGDSAFSGCISLKSISIPYSVISIDSSAFSRCSSLTHIAVDSCNNAYSSLDGVLFNKNKTMLICYPAGKTAASYIIPDIVTSIGNAAFYYCSSLTSITIPDSVTSIGDSAFGVCSSLTVITIPDSVTSIGNAAFGSCSSLTAITIPNSVTSIGDSAFDYCTSLTSITIPNSVTSIGDYAFYYCSSLKSITIPNSVKSIGPFAFNYCSSLISVTIPNSVTRIGNDAFGHCYSLTSITIPDSVTSIDYFAFSCCSSLKSITIPDSVTSIGSYTFLKCSSLKSITIPDSVTSIGGSAFSGCSSLTDITIPDSVTSIGNAAFYDCNNLTIFSNLGSVSDILSKTSYKYKCFGDMNDDKTLNGSDITKMKKALFGIFDSDYDEKVADINQDDSFNILDLVRLKKFMAE